MNITYKYQYKILNNILPSRIQYLIKFIIYHDQESFSPECKLFQLILYTILIDLKRIKLKIISGNVEKSLWKISVPIPDFKTKSSKSRDKFLMWIFIWRNTRVISIRTKTRQNYPLSPLLFIIILDMFDNETT